MNGMGEEYTAWFCARTAEKLARAHTDEEKWAVRKERQRFLVRSNVLMARGNYAIFRNAQPVAGGPRPPAPRIEYE